MVVVFLMLYFALVCAHNLVDLGPLSITRSGSVGVMV